MPVYTTGRTRTITVTGTFSGSTAYEFDPNTLAGFQRNVLLSVTLFTTVGLPGAWPTVMGFEVNSAGLGTFGSGWNYQGENIEWNASTGFGIASSSGSHPFGTPGFPLVPVADSLNLGGSFTASIEVEECVEVEPLTGSDVDVYGWPQYGDAGSARRHNRAPFAQSARYFERIFPGASVTFSFNAGPISWSGSGTYSGVAQEIAREHLCVVGTEGQASGVALPSGTTTMTVLENGEPLGYTESHSWSSGSISNSGNTNAGATVSMSGDTGGAVRNNYAVVEGWHRPPTKYKLELTAWRHDERVNFDTTWRVVEDSTGTKTVVVALGDAERDVDQRRSQWVFNLGPTLASPDPAAQKSGSFSNLSPLRAWLADSWLAASGESRWNWRALARGRVWDALDVDHDVSRVLQSGASLTGWSGAASAGVGAVQLGGNATRTFAPPADLAGYRWLRVQVRSVGGDGHAATMAIGGKAWSVAGGTAGVIETRWVDLCCPMNSTWASDGQWSRFPVTFGTEDSLALSDAWGVGRVGAMAFSGVTGALDILEIAAVRRSFARVSPMMWMWPDRELLLRWDSPTDMTYGWIGMILDADGRANDVHDQAFVMPDSGVDEYYTLYSIGAVADMVDQLGGWSGTALAGVDAYHGPSAAACTLHGGGYLQTYGGGWQVGRDLGLGTIAGQALWDEVQLYPGAGEVWTAGAYLVRSRVSWAWNCRSRLAGNVFTLGNVPASGASVTSSPSGGSGTTDTLGSYRTGLPFFSASSGYVVTSLGVDASPGDVFIGATKRLCFRGAPTEGPLHVDCIQLPWGGFATAFSAGAGVRVWRSDQPLPTAWASVVSASSGGGDVQPRMRVDSRTAALVLQFVRDGVLFESSSTDDGVTWSPPASTGLSMKWADTGSDARGFEYRARFVPNSGTSGPGRISVQWREPGGTWSAWTEVQAGGSPVTFADSTFRIQPTRDGQQSWVLAAIKDGQTVPSHFVSRDEGETWTEL